MVVNSELRSHMKSVQKSSHDTLRAYLVEIGRYPLLTREEEQEHGTAAHQAAIAVEIRTGMEETLKREISKAEWAVHVGLQLKGEEWDEPTFDKFLRCGARSRQRMMEGNLRLVVNVAKKYQNRGLELQDLIQEGGIGLSRAVDKFDPSRGFKFSTYAYWWIRQSITRAIAEKSRNIRLPIHVTEKLNKLGKLRRIAFQEGRDLSRDEIAEALSGKFIKSNKDVDVFLRRVSPVLSLNKITNDGDSEFGDFVEDSNSNPEDTVDRSLLQVTLNQAMSVLEPRHRQVMQLRAKGQSLQLVGEQMGLSRERIRQIETSARAKLKRNPALREFLSSLD